MKTWTVAEVKAELPPVQVRIGKKIVTGRLSGRVNRFASVTVWNEGTLHSGSKFWMDWSVAWETVAHCLNRGVPIIVEAS